MSANAYPEPLLDREFGSLNVEAQNEYLKALLWGLLSGESFKRDIDCALTLFSMYGWEQRRSKERKEYFKLYLQGMAGELDPPQFDAFLDMVSVSGGYPRYFLIRRALVALGKVEGMEDPERRKANTGNSV